MDEHMKIALDEAYEGIRSGHGGPFGSVIVRDGTIIGRGHNRVVIDKDPTAHGEVVAIRDACRNIGSFSLSGCVLYTTAEPCPMCLGAILWAGIDKVYYGCNKLDTDGIGFRDDKFYRMMSEGMGDALVCIERDKCLKLFNEYSSRKDKTAY